MFKLILFLLCIACVQALQIQIYILHEMKLVKPIIKESKPTKTSLLNETQDIEIIEMDGDIVYEKDINAVSGYFNNRNKWITY